LERSSQRLKPEIEAKFRTLAESLDAYRDLLTQSAAPNVRDLRARYHSMAAEYEAALVGLREMGYRSWVARGHIKPVNYWRNLFHAGNASLAFALYQWFLTREQALFSLGAIAVVAVAMEVSRRYFPRWNEFLVNRVFGLVSRPREKHAVNSATWYLFALMIACALFSKPALLVALLILGFSDPIASLVGKRWGTRKLRGQKSFQGTWAFLISAAGLTVAYGALVGVPFLSLGGLIWVVGVPLATTGAELYGDRVDDNFGILIAGGAVASLSIYLMGSVI
jgi:dolichol kinase